MNGNSAAETAIRIYELVLGLLMLVAFLQFLRLFLLPRASKQILWVLLLLLALSLPLLAVIRAGH
jgi:hypothetical protein